MTEFEKLLACLPGEPDFAWSWDGLRVLPIGPLLDKMEQTPQYAAWHGEGNVFNHTKLVCEALASLPEYRAYPVRQRQALALAALLHDVAKPYCTRMDGGMLAAPHHASSGARDVRRLLWQDFGLSGEKDLQIFRETVCLFIRFHSLPLHLVENENPHLKARAVAANGEQVPMFTLRMLCLLAEADVLGRVCGDRQELLDAIEMSREIAVEAGCPDGPWPFPSACTRRAYLCGRNVWPEQALYDDTWGEVILMCGLPGTGKDTWIAQNHPGLPMVSMDELRRQMGISPGDEQGAVVQQAMEQARVHLRAKQPFVWNATSLTPLTRAKVISLAEQYHASVRIVYLEAPWNENLIRNAGRRYVVPEKVISDMLGKFIPPEAAEARHVDWICT